MPGEMPMPIHPQVGEFLADLKSAGGKPTEQCTPDEVRAAVRAGHPRDEPPEAVQDVEDLQIAGPAGNIPVRIYRPLERRAQGAVAFYHGGGWVAGDLDTHDALCRALANEGGVVVMAVDYRLAPEHPYPAAADDAYAGFQWLKANAAKYNVDPERIAVCGDSAGGNLAAVVSLMARDRGEPSPCLQVLVYPVTDFRFDTTSYLEYANGFGLTAAGMRSLWEHYLGDEDRANEPYASPLRADDLSGLPPAVVLTARFDVLHDESRAYAERLQSAGVPTELIAHDDMIHGFLGKFHLFDSARVAVRQLAASMSRLLLVCLALGLSRHGLAAEHDPSPQYEHEEIVIPAASGDESKLDVVSLEKGLRYVEQGAAAWAGSRGCVACHTTGSYLRMRPLLTNALGKPSEQMRDFFIAELEGFEQQAVDDADSLQAGITPAQIAYIALGLAEWDAHVTGQLSGPTRRALTVMMAAQSPEGVWGNTECWPPFESSEYQASTVAAMAAATAPGWRENLQDEKQREGIDALRNYLQKTTPPHEYGRVLLLWAATRWPELLDESRRGEIVNQIQNLQQKDGGWSIRRFAKPEEWGDGSRAEKLRTEEEFRRPASDGHMTGLALIALLDAGVSADDPSIVRGMEWLEANQRASGRWWTRSLNTDTYHFITFSSTLYAMVALDKGGRLVPER